MNILVPFIVITDAEIIDESTKKDEKIEFSNYLVVQM